MYSAAHTRVVCKISNNHLSDVDSEDDGEDGSVHSATAEENNNDANARYLSADGVSTGGVGADHVSVGDVGAGDIDADASSTSDKENVPVPPTAAYVAQLEAEIQALEGELALANELRAEEMDATRRTRARLFQYIARVQGLAESMIVRDM